MTAGVASPLVKGIGRPVRYRCELHARLTLEGEEPRMLRVLDLSEGGAFLASDDELDFGATGLLTLALPGGDPFDVKVRVVRLGSSQLEVRHKRVELITVSRTGAGVVFEELPEEEIERLRGFLELLDER